MSIAWEEVAGSSFKLYTHNVALLPGHDGAPSTLLSTGGCFRDEEMQHVKISRDDGRTWSEYPNKDWMKDESAIRDTSKHASVVLAREDGGYDVYISGGTFDWETEDANDCVRVSHDEGETWERCGSTPFNAGMSGHAMCVIPGTDHFMLVGGLTTSEIGDKTDEDAYMRTVGKENLACWISTDKGKTWNLVNPYFGTHRGSLTLVPVPEEGRIILYSSDNLTPVLQTTDNGVTWAFLAPTPTTGYSTPLGYIDGKLYVIGRNTTYDVKPKVYALDMSEDSDALEMWDELKWEGPEGMWEKTTYMPTFTLLPDKRTVIATGGSGLTTEDETDELQFRVWVGHLSL